MFIPFSHQRYLHSTHMLPTYVSSLSQQWLKIVILILALLSPTSHQHLVFQAFVLSILSMIVFIPYVSSMHCKILVS